PFWGRMRGSVFHSGPQGISSLAPHGIGAKGEQTAQLLVRHFRDPRLARPDNGFRKRHLALDQVVQCLLKGTNADELVHLYVAVLTDSERPVRGLVLDGGVPPAVEVEDVVCSGEVQPRSTRLDGEDEDRRTMLLVLKLLHHAV